MAEITFESVVLDAALADGLQKVQDSVACFQMEVEEIVQDLGNEVES